MSQVAGISALAFPMIAIPPPPIQETGYDLDAMIESHGHRVSKGLTIAGNTLPAAGGGRPL